MIGHGKANKQRLWPVSAARRQEAHAKATSTRTRVVMPDQKMIFAFVPRRLIRVYYIT